METEVEPRGGQNIVSKLRKNRTNLVIPYILLSTLIVFHRPNEASLSDDLPQSIKMLPEING